MSQTLTLEDLWVQAGFNPNLVQKQAILHIQKPLFLTAGPGSGKTRVLLWRTVNLLVFHGVQPEEIFLSTFTEKAAHQLKEGLRNYLGMVTNITGVYYDISNMYVGTVHSLCQTLLKDRRFNKAVRKKQVSIIEALNQYFFVANRKNWKPMIEAAGWAGFSEEDQQFMINRYFTEASTPDNKVPTSRHISVTNCISFFNRLSEECADYEALIAARPDSTLKSLLQMYRKYRQILEDQPALEKCDFALLQQKAYDLLLANPDSGKIFKHVIIDEYQDTNTIQEKLYFKLADYHKNICVVGDDDQALYRFRGATVENFVEFPNRCQTFLNTIPTKIPLNINYRSRHKVVTTYTDFITSPHFNWKKEGKPNEYYRVHDKQIQAHSTDNEASVIASTPGKPEDVAAEIATMVRRLLDSGKVKDPNQIAFLFPALRSSGQKNIQVQRMQTALENIGIRVYAPRAGRFLEVDESIQLFGIYILIFGKPDRGHYTSIDYNNFHDWLNDCEDVAKEICKKDKNLAEFIKEKKEQIATATKNFHLLQRTARNEGWALDEQYNIATMKRRLAETPGISSSCQKSLINKYFEKEVNKRLSGESELPPYKLKEVITRATSLDWNILDLFYRLCGFDNFKKMIDLAEKGIDEGPICNLGLLTEHLANFIEIYKSNVLTASFLADNKFQITFFMSFLYAIYRNGESEFENAEDPFPKGRIPFLTIHQAKGLEFPVVVLANLRKDDWGASILERTIRNLIPKESEPLDRIGTFDIARTYYVALSRPQNLLILAHFKGVGQQINEPFKTMLANPGFPRIPTFDISTLPEAKPNDEKPPKAYSYTADFLVYDKCPRQYMIFRRYGFAPSRSQTMFFGSLVHRTIEDLHHELITKYKQNV